jgi:hypothetical protein
MGYLPKLVLFLLALSTYVTAQNGWSTPINISANPDTALYGHDIVVGSDGTIYILYDDCWGPECSITELVLKKSTDGGITWTERQVISDGLGTYWSPQLAVDSKGVLHVVYYKRGEWRPYYITSENNWSAPVPYTEYGCQNAKIYVDKKDVVHFFWTLLAYDTLVAHRTLSRGLWSTPEIISDLSFRSVGTSVCFDEENNMHVIFEGYNVFYHFNLFYRKRGPAGWGKYELLTTDSLYYPTHYSVNIVNNTLYVIWSKFVSWELFNQIYWTYKSAADLTSPEWSEPEAINNHSLAFDPAVVVDKDNTMHLVWMRKSNTGTGEDSLFYSYLKNNVWSPVQNLPFQLLHPLGQPHIVSAEKQVYIIFFGPSANFIY